VRLIDNTTLSAARRESPSPRLEREALSACSE
jgi:hypothetical protein